MIATTTTVKSKGLTLSLLCKRHYRRRSRGMLEAVLAANPDLARYGPILPLGTVLVLPAPPEDAATDEDVTLWD